ncbi:translation initiation factor IF-1 [Ureaplasma diversum]|uniref:Translation initiation factor IF-1 n=2 Tax=Ureaplasma diversum TaxID=42094 RepID=A0A084F1P5_9BACT|nr:translation initiation factor IF-1 [Ureaplasma diversum]AJQ45619.1 translation initiation factor IF-1 [Ureaplasma diversum]KEZ24137.1 Translation initiation factor IF-1 [Ureaplasma diversum NCTC 246]
MSDNDKLKMSGKIVEVLQGGNFKVQLENDIVITGHVSGKMRMHKINILPGDTVDVELSPYDLTRGRIIFRHRDVIKRT